MSKSVLTFYGPRHHNQLIRPVADALKAQGYDVIPYTADAEAQFQAGLNQDFGTYGYRWLPDYYDDRATEKLYDSHVAYFQEHLRSPSPLSLMPPQVLDRITLFAARDSIGTKRLIEHVKPAFCLALHELNRWGMLLGYHAHEKNIPLFTLQEGLYYGDPWIYTGHNRYSHSFIWGEGTKGKLVSAGNEEGRIHALGHPDLGGRIGNAGVLAIPQDLPEEARGRKVLFLFLGMVETQMDMAPMLDGITESNWFVVARVHQLSSLPAIEKARVAFNRPGSMFSFEREDDFAHHWRLIAHADAFIHVGCTTMALEWAYTGKPQGQFSVRNQHRDFASEGISVPVENLRLVEACAKIEREWATGQWKENQAKFVANELTSANAAERIAAEMIRMSKEKS